MAILFKTKIPEKKITPAKSQAEIMSIIENILSPNSAKPSDLFNDLKDLNIFFHQQKDDTQSLISLRKEFENLFAEIASRAQNNKMNNPTGNQVAFTNKIISESNSLKEALDKLLDYLNQSQTISQEIEQVRASTGDNATNKIKI